MAKARMRWLYDSSSYASFSKSLLNIVIASAKSALMGLVSYYHLHQPIQLELSMHIPATVLEQNHCSSIIWSEGHCQPLPAIAMWISIISRRIPQDDAVCSCQWSRQLIRQQCRSERKCERELHARLEDSIGCSQWRGSMGRGEAQAWKRLFWFCKRFYALPPPRAFIMMKNRIQRLFAAYGQTNDSSLTNRERSNLGGWTENTT